MGEEGKMKLTTKIIKMAKRDFRKLTKPYDFDNQIEKIQLIKGDRRNYYASSPICCLNLINSITNFL